MFVGAQRLGQACLGAARLERDLLAFMRRPAGQVHSLEPRQQFPILTVMFPVIGQQRRQGVAPQGMFAALAEDIGKPMGAQVPRQA